jgi:ABC-type polar amino acid transport system ATPase subunit
LAIQVRDVRKRFGSREVLGGVSVSFRAGETVAILGPSGGGKSTLLRCLNGLTPFDAGEIDVGPYQIRPGRNGVALREVRRLYGMIFQDFQLFPHLTVLENVIEAPMRVLGLAQDVACARAERILSRVGMAGHLDHYPRELSGGQKQRVAIARALAMEPRGLFCDEITSSLDPELKYEVLRVLEDLRRDGMTLIMVTHEIGFAARVADRVVVLCDGRILEDGPPSQVLREPRTERMRLFLERVLG